MISGCEFKGLGSMNCLRLLMIWTTLGHELRALDAMNNTGLWWIRTTPSYGLRPLHAMNNSGLWLIWTTLGHELGALNFFNNSRLWMTWTTSGHRFKILWTSQGCGWLYEWLGILWGSSSRFYKPIKAGKNMNDFVSWAQAFRCYELLNVCGWHEWPRVVSLGVEMLPITQACDWLKQLRVMSSRV